MRRGRRILAAGLALAASAGVCGPAAAAGPLSVPGFTLWVDTESRGGPCRDDRPALMVSQSSPLCSLDRAAALVPDGGAVVVRQGVYPRLTVRRAMTLRTTFIAYPGERPAVFGITAAASAARQRFQGFRLRDVTLLDGHDLELVGNELTPHGVVLDGARNLAEGNDIHDLRIVFNPSRRYDSRRCARAGKKELPLTMTAGIAPRCGYAFRVSGEGHVIRGNRMFNIPADGVQMRNTRGVTIAGNLFDEIDAFIDPLEHSDGVQVIGTNVGTVIRDNLFHNTRGVLSMVYPDPDPAKVTYPRDLVISGNTFKADRNLNRRIGNGCMSLSAGVGIKVFGNTCTAITGVSTGGGIYLWKDQGRGRLQVDVQHNDTRDMTIATAEGVREDYNRVRRLVVRPGVRFTPGPNTVVGP